MGNNIKKQIKRTLVNEHFRQTILFILMVIAANLCLDICSYQNYQDKITILEQMLRAGDTASINTAIEILKQEKTNLPQKELDRNSLLAQYGYAGAFQNRYFVRFYRQCITAAAVSAVVLTVALFAVRARERSQRTAQESYFRLMAQRLVQIQENNRKKNSEADRNSSGTDIKTSFPLMKGYEDVCTYMNEKLELLTEDLSRIQKQTYEEKEKTKGIVTDISHQLKTPVAALDTCFTVLDDPALKEEERKEFYIRCRNELEGLKALLDSLLQISRLEAGMIKIEKKRALLLDTVLAAVNRIYPKASAKKIEIVCDYAPGMEHLSVLQDEKWLCEALINVLDNAVKYSPCGSEIRIAIQQLVQIVRIEIADQGPGIPKQEFHKVFQRFYRGSSRQVQKESGSGVGLYLAREIVNEHHGYISVKAGCENSTDYPGSVFVIRFPLK